MELTTLDKILHGPLKPWKIDDGIIKLLAEKIKAAKTTDPKTGAELNIFLTTLLEGHTFLQEIIRAEENLGHKLYQPLFFTQPLPDYKDIVSQYYFLLINYEVIRVYNVLLVNWLQWKDPRDITFQIEKKALNNIKVLAIQTATELQERNFVSTPDDQSDNVHFALFYLKHSLIALFFSLQEIFKANLTKTISLDDFYILDLREPRINILPLTQQNSPEIKQIDSIEKEKTQSVYPDFKSNIIANPTPTVGAVRDRITIPQHKQTALEHLKFFSGYNRANEKIMSVQDFQKLITYIYLLIETGKVPAKIKAIPQTGLENNFIRYCFYKLHEKLYTTKKIKMEWIDFIHAVFAQFNGTSKTTTQKKFSEKPKSYYADMDIMEKVI